MMKGTSMTMSELLFGMVCVFMVFAGISIFTTNLFTEYPTNVTSNFSTINRMANFTNQTDYVMQDLQSAQESASAGSYLGAGYYGIKGGWDAMLSMVSMTNIFTATITDVNEETKGYIPDWMIQGIMICFTLILIFALLAFIGKVNL